MLDLTLDSPGSIAVIGGGPIGLEIAIYGRYLGYEMHLFEAGEIGQTLYDRPGVELQAPLEQCCSPLGLAAIRTNDPDHLLPPMDRVLVAGMYRDLYLLPLAETDLLAGRIHTQTPVRGLELVDVDATASDDEEVYEQADELPADFKLCFDEGIELDLPADSPVAGGLFEAVVLAHGAAGSVDRPADGNAEIAGDPDRDLLTEVPYLFQLGRAADADLTYLHGLEQTRRLFARLTGRPQLDLYRLSHP